MASRRSWRIPIWAIENNRRLAQGLVISASSQRRLGHPIFLHLRVLRPTIDFGNQNSGELCCQPQLHPTDLHELSVGQRKDAITQIQTIPGYNPTHLTAGKRSWLRYPLASETFGM